MRYLKTVLFFLLLMPAVLMADTQPLTNPAEVYAKANAFYRSQNYAKAITLYNTLVDGEYATAEVYYNLGNAWYQSGNYGKAIVNYERALRLSPSDEDIQFNLKLAQLKTIDKIDALPELFYRRWINTIATTYNADRWASKALILAWMLLAAAALFLFARRLFLKRAGFIIAVVLLCCAGFCWLMASQNDALTRLSKSAVIMSPTAYIKSSPAENNPDLFLLHEGTKVSLLDTYENWAKVSIANGSMGWVKKSDIEVI